MTTRSQRTKRLVELGSAISGMRDPDGSGFCPRCNLPLAVHPLDEHGDDIARCPDQAGPDNGFIPLYGSHPLTTQAYFLTGYLSTHPKNVRQHLRDLIRACGIPMPPVVDQDGRPSAAEFAVADPDLYGKEPPNEATPTETPASIRSDFTMGPIGRAFRDRPEEALKIMDEWSSEWMGPGNEPLESAQSLRPVTGWAATAIVIGEVVLAILLTAAVLWLWAHA